jgi:transposase-like protein
MNLPFRRCRMEIESGTPKRFWALHKTQAVLRLLRGEDIDLVRRELEVTAGMLSQWRDTFLAAGESGLKPHPVKKSVEVVRLREKLGEQAMENELLREKIARLGQNRPLARGKSRK